MYALVEILGKQYKVSVGDQIEIDHMSEDVGKTVSFDTVLAKIDGDACTFGTPYISGSSVKAEVVEQTKGEKIKVYKYHRRKGYRRTQGHREQYTLVKITNIQ